MKRTVTILSLALCAALGIAGALQEKAWQIRPTAPANESNLTPEQNAKGMAELNRLTRDIYSKGDKDTCDKLVDEILAFDKDYCIVKYGGATGERGTDFLFFAAFHSLATRGFTTEQLARLCTGLKSSRNKNLASQAEGRERLMALANKPMDFSCPTVDRKTLNMKDFRGKIVLVYAFGCG